MTHDNITKLRTVLSAIAAPCKTEGNLLLDQWGDSIARCGDAETATALALLCNAGPKLLNALSEAVTLVQLADDGTVRADSIEARHVSLRLEALRTALTRLAEFP